MQPIPFCTHLYTSTSSSSPPVCFIFSIGYFRHSCANTCLYTVTACGSSAVVKLAHGPSGVQRSHANINLHDTQLKMSKVARTVSSASRIVFYYDVVCPFAYMASTVVEDMASRAGATVEWKPVLLGESEII